MALPDSFAYFLNSTFRDLLTAADGTCHSTFDLKPKLLNYMKKFWDKSQIFGILQNMLPSNRLHFPLLCRFYDFLLLNHFSPCLTHTNSSNTFHDFFSPQNFIKMNLLKKLVLYVLRIHSYSLYPHGLYNEMIWRSSLKDDFSIN